MNGKFYLNDLARNFTFTNLETHKELEVCTEIQADKTYTINYGTSTIVFRIT